MSADTPLLCAGNARQLIDEMTDFSFAGGRLIRAELEAVASGAAVVVDRALVELVIANMRDEISDGSAIQAWGVREWADSLERAMAGN